MDLFHQKDLRSASATAREHLGHKSGVKNLLNFAQANPFDSFSFAWHGKTLNAVSPFLTDLDNFSDWILFKLQQLAASRLLSACDISPSLSHFQTSATF